MLVKNRKFIETKKQKQTLKARLNSEINPKAKKRKMSKMLSLYVIASAWTPILANTGI